MDIKKLIKNLTAEEKAALVSGTDFMYTNPVPRLGIPSLCMSDGPHGLRKQDGDVGSGMSYSQPATVFPTAACTASSWEPEITFRMGRAIARECRHYGVHMLLGPGANIKRNPLCGRNFEYYSEDPLLSGLMASGEVEGLQSLNVGACVKHFALNNSENYRLMGNSVADSRSMRELYLKSFEHIIRKANPASIMCAYNQVNGTFCSANKFLLTDMLRETFGFDGAVVSDWGATQNRIEALKAGLDIEMPGDTSICRRKILDGLKDGRVPEEVLDKAVENVLKLVDKYVKDQPEEDFDRKAHHALAGELVENSAVLLKNEGILPLTGNEKLLIVGDFFRNMRYQGAGSSMINPTEITSPKDAFDERGIKYEFCRGYSENVFENVSEDVSEDNENALIEEAAKSAENADTVLVFMGLTDVAESEGFDRQDMKLPENQLRLMEALIKTGRKIAVVLFGGSAVELPFAENVDAILNLYLPGQNGGSAAVRLLYGDVSPSGRLAETWPEKYEDVPFGEGYSSEIREIYKESVYVGYRYYLTAGKKVRYPFGYGLSYTSFSVGDLQTHMEEDNLKVSCCIQNTGKRQGHEVIQVYVSCPSKAVFRPLRELKAFRKVLLEPGEKKTVTMDLPLKELCYFDTAQNRWVLEDGDYEIQICSDCETVRMSQKVNISGEKAVSPYSKAVMKAYTGANLEKITDNVFEEMAGFRLPEPVSGLPFTMESRITDMKLTFPGRIIFKPVLKIAMKKLNNDKKPLEGVPLDNRKKEELFLKKSLENSSVRSMVMTAGKMFPYNVGQALVEFVNGHIVRGIGYLIKKIIVPKLPKEEH